MTDRIDPDRHPQFYAQQVAMDDVDNRLDWADPRRSFSRYAPDESRARHDCD